MTTQGGSYSWNATCDVCGFQYKAQDLKKRWDGLMVCEADFETRHPLDFYRVKNDHHQLPFVRKDDIQNTGFLNATGYTTYEDAVGNGNTIGSRFTVGSTSRYLRGIRIGGDTINGYVLEAPALVKLWTDAGVLIRGWLVQPVRYPASEIDKIAWLSLPLLPTETLAASTTYRISVLAPSGQRIVTSSAITSTQPFITYNSSFYDAGDAFPTTALATTQATPYLDIITGSTN